MEEFQHLNYKLTIMRMQRSAKNRRNLRRHLVEHDSLTVATEGCQFCEHEKGVMEPDTPKERETFLRDMEEGSGMIERARKILLGRFATSAGQGMAGAATVYVYVHPCPVHVFWLWFSGRWGCLLA